MASVEDEKEASECLDLIYTETSLATGVSEKELRAVVSSP
jgi:hypothetical protein